MCMVGPDLGLGNRDGYGLGIGDGVDADGDVHATTGPGRGRADDSDQPQQPASGDIAQRQNRIRFGLGLGVGFSLRIVLGLGLGNGNRNGLGFGLGVRQNPVLWEPTRTAYDQEQRSMRILLVSHGFPPANLGGTEIYTRDLAVAFREEVGDEVVVLTREADASRPEYELRSGEVAGIPVRWVNNTFARCRSFAETYRNPAIREVGARVLDEVSPDVCHIQHLTCLSTELVDELARRGIPTVMTLNDYWLLCHRGQLLNLRLQRCDGPDAGCGPCIAEHAGHGRVGFTAAAALRAVDRGLPAFLAGPLRSLAVRAASRLVQCDLAEGESESRRAHMLELTGKVSRLLAPSNTLREHFLAFGVEPERIVRVQQGLDHAPFSSVAPAGSAAPRFGFLGSMMESKGAHVLLEAFSGLREGSASLHIFGGFADYHGDDSFRHRVASWLDQPGVVVHGPVPHERVAEAFSAFDVLVVPSIWLENAPFVIREAFVAGRPVVTSDIGGMAELVEHEVCGLRCAPGDVAALGETLQRFVDEPDLLIRLQAGIPQMMTIADDARQLRAMYEEIAASP